MGLKSYRASAPGTVMLMGEHAVLHSEPAIVASIDKRITITLLPRADDIVIINSSEFPSFSSSLELIKIESPYTFVTAVISMLRDIIPSGFELSIKSDFKSTIGLGSSSAVTVATLKVILYWLDSKEQDLLTIFKMARQAIVQVQGTGSGADAAASVFGGVVYYLRDKSLIETMPCIPKITLIYSGVKVPTTEVLAKINKLAAEDTAAYSNYYRMIGAIVEQAKVALIENDLTKLGILFNRQQHIMGMLGVSTFNLSTIVSGLLVDENILGAKISGSGLGDCVVGLGSTSLELTPWQVSAGIRQIDVAISEQGVTCEY